MTGNIAQLLLRRVEESPAQLLYRHFVEDAWQDVTAGEVAAQAARWQTAFRREGLQPGDRVALCLRNGVSWVAVDMAALGLGLVVVPLYVDDNPDNVAWCAANAEARLLIVENSRIAAALAKVQDPQQPLPPLVIVRPDAGESSTTAATWLPQDGGEFTVADVAPATLATICFTSGTSGRPKGVMLTHANILANVEQCRATNMARPDDLFLSILPLSHMFERTGGYYLPLSLGARVAYARGVAQIADDLASQAPTAMFAVPRIFERFRARIEQSLESSAAKRMLFDACVSRGFRLATGKGTLVDRMVVPLLQRAVATPVLARLGGRLRLVVVGGAALDPLLARTFIGLGLPMLQGYGMTEASPVISVNLINDNVPESVGPPVAGMEVKFRETGELLVRGANMMAGYWRNPEASAAVLADGWLSTGDIAELLDGKIHIRGRAKDILVLSNGEKLPPQDAEFAILHDPIFEQVMLVGEGRPYVVLLAVSKETDQKVLIRRANEQLKAFPRWARVRRVVSSVEPWSVDNGLLTPTLKLRRPLLLKQRAAEIEAAYAGSNE
ncbi:MAG: AMP-dependent synthetase/ligase [Casimicrobiaceae bacterium]